jgi:hypothetical protein
MDTTIHGERWKFIPNTDEAYQVSNLGRIRRLKNGSWVYIRQSKHRYLRVGIKTNGKHKSYNTHALVMITFRGYPKPGFNIDHKNGIKTDNRLRNLQYVRQEINTLRGFQRRRALKKLISILGKANAKKQNEINSNMQMVS